MNTLNWNHIVYTSFRTAYLDLLGNKAPRKISIAELSEKAGYARSTFYQYFNDILELDEKIRIDVLDFMGKQISRPNSPIQPTTKILVQESTYDIYHWFLACQCRRQELLTYLMFRPNRNFYNGIREQLMYLVKCMAIYDNLPDDRETEYYLIYQVEGTIGMLLHYLMHHSDEDPASMVYVFNGYHRYRSWVTTNAPKEVRDTTMELMEDILHLHRHNFKL